MTAPPTSRQFARPTVSIVTVNYKHHKRTTECIQRTLRVIENISVPWEILIVDNDSPNESYKHLSGYFRNHPMVKVIQAPRNGGYGYGNNLGYRAAVGEILWFLNSDAWISNISNIDALVDLVVAPGTGLVSTASTDNAGEAHPVGGGDASFRWFVLSTLRAGALFRRFTVLRRIVPVVGRALGMHSVAQYLDALKHNEGPDIKETTLVSGASFLCRRSVFEQLNGFDERFFLYDEDIDLSVRSVRAGYRNFICRGASVIHIGSESVRQERQTEIVRTKKASRLYYAEKHFSGWKRISIKLLTLITYRWL